MIITLREFKASLSDSIKQKILNICAIDKLDADSCIEQIYSNIYCDSGRLYVEFEAIVDELKMLRKHMV